MILYPAIDLKQGACVRLKRGRMKDATIFNDNPADQAEQFERAGCNWLHVVDLDGAFSGESSNSYAIRAIRARVEMQIQLGGGIRTMANIEHWLEAGVSRVILGTAALKQPQLVKDAARRFPKQIAVGIDADGGRVAVEGWAEVSDMRAVDLAKLFEDAGVAAIIYTDIARDGLMKGPNLDETAALAEAIRIPVILSGGVSTMADVKNIYARAASGIAGMIVGRALYEGAIDLKEALRITSHS
jgi:phosphoribosylformimino-5-aminoimidazole carboxamide ribotide isomerase